MDFEATRKCVGSETHRLSAVNRAQRRPHIPAGPKREGEVEGERGYRLHSGAAVRGSMHIDGADRFIPGSSR